MNIHYKIIEVWPNDHLFVVRYYTDNLNEEMLISANDYNRREDGSPMRCRTDVAIDMPIPALEGKELESLILYNSPISFLRKMEDVLNPDIDTSMSGIIDMINKPVTKSTTELLAKKADVLSDDDIKNLIESLSKDNFTNKSSNSK
jgi:hypothetical protein